MNAVLAFAPRSPVVYISPHLDDVALSCSVHLSANPGARVVTVIAGSPDIDNPEESWHYRTTGCHRAPEGVALRREEDRCAMDALGARFLHLGFWDAEYVEDRHQDVASMASAISDAVVSICPDPASVVVPLGLHHSDHVAVAHACVHAFVSGMFPEEIDLYCFADLPYAVAFPDERAARLDELRTSFRAMAALRPVAANAGLKHSLARLYGSQYEPLRLYEDFSFAFDNSMEADEEYWLLHSGSGPHDHVEPAREGTPASESGGAR